VLYGVQFKRLAKYKMVRFQGVHFLFGTLLDDGIVKAQTLAGQYAMLLHFKP